MHFLGAHDIIIYAYSSLKDHLNVTILPLIMTYILHIFEKSIPQGV